MFTFSGSTDAGFGSVSTTACHKGNMKMYQKRTLKNAAKKLDKNLLKKENDALCDETVKYLHADVWRQKHEGKNAEKWYNKGEGKMDDEYLEEHEYSKNKPDTKTAIDSEEKQDWAKRQKGQKLIIFKKGIAWKHENGT